MLLFIIGNLSQYLKQISSAIPIHREAWFPIEYQVFPGNSIKKNHYLDMEQPACSGVASPNWVVKLSYAVILLFSTFFTIKGWSLCIFWVRWGRNRSFDPCVNCEEQESFMYVILHFDLKLYREYNEVSGFVRALVCCRSTAGIRQIDVRPCVDALRS